MKNNMKKILVAVLAAGMLWSLAACGAPDQKSETQSQQEAGAEEPKQKQDAPSETAAVDSQIFGKVKAIAGNELTFSLAKMPSLEGDEEEKPAGGGDTGGMEGAIAATETVPAQEGGEGMEQPKIDLEYTGEEKEFIVPAGAPILGTGGQNETLQSIKKGNVLLLNLDKDGVIVSVTVCE